MAKVILRAILENVPYKEIGNSSFSIEKENIYKALLFVRGITISDTSHFGVLDYHLAARYPYHFRKASFTILNSKVYIDCKDEGEMVYTGCNLSAPHLTGMRLNAYGDCFEILLDHYMPNSGFSGKCISFKISSKLPKKNTEIAKKLQTYRKLYYTNRGKAIECYTEARLWMSLKNTAYTRCPYDYFHNDAEKLHLSQYSHHKVYVLQKEFFNKTGIVTDTYKIVLETGKSCNGQDCMVSLNPHPLGYETLANLRTAVSSVMIPGLIVHGAYYLSTPEVNQLFIRYSAVDMLRGNTVAAVYSPTVKTVIPDICIYAFHGNELCEWLNENDVEDIYDIISGKWVSDYLISHLVSAQQQYCAGSSDCVCDIEGTELKAKDKGQNLKESAKEDTGKQIPHPPKAEIETLTLF